MAVTETGAIFNSLVFGGIDSADYGIYITGEAVYNAPTRAVEMVSVPGRNGAILVDQGYYENIEVSYPCGTFAQTQAEFATNLASFRNAILSQKGYKRLTDTYNPNEFRMATYIAGLEVSPTNIGIAGEFSLKFNAKPQRWLTSGESSQTIAASGRTITNPTLYDASPLVEVEGYGTITVNGHEIEIENATLGEVTLLETTQDYRYYPTTDTIPGDYLNTGDTIYLSGLNAIWALHIDGASHYQFPEGGTSTVTQSDTDVTLTWIATPDNSTFYRFSLSFPDIPFTFGTSGSYQCTTTISGVTKYDGIGASATLTAVYTHSVSYDATTNTITCSSSASSTVEGNVYTVTRKRYPLQSSSVIGDSSLTILGNPTYIDCDLGVCYKVESGTVIDLNGYIDLGSDLPVLSPGSNTITYDNTITGVDIVPRWWQL